MFEYDGDNQFHIYNLPYYPSIGDELLFNHWHEELEIVYTLQGNSLHYIDGTCIRSQPGRLIVVNSESSHNIIPDRSVYGNGRKVVIALIISREFLEEVFPDFRNMYFLNEKEVTTPVIRELMVTLSHFGDGTELSRYEKIYRKGLVLQLLYHITQEGGGGEERDSAA